jgi:hypothetical protein
LADLISAAQSTTFSINGQSVGDLSAANTMNELIAEINSVVSGVEVSSFIETTATGVGTDKARFVL